MLTTASWEPLLVLTRLITGFDNISAFFGEGKWKAVQRSGGYDRPMVSIGKELAVSEETFQFSIYTEASVCELNKYCHRMDELRYEIHRKAGKSSLRICPPCELSFRLYMSKYASVNSAARRAGGGGGGLGGWNWLMHYQATTWRGAIVLLSSLALWVKYVHVYRTNVVPFMRLVADCTVCGPWTLGPAGFTLWCNCREENRVSIQTKLSECLFLSVYLLNLDSRFSWCYPGQKIKLTRT